MNRRQFFKRSVAAPAVAALVSKGEAIAAPRELVLYADGEHDDTTALNAWWVGKPVKWDNGKPVSNVIRQRLFLVNTGLAIDRKSERLVLCGFKINEAFDVARFTRAAGKIRR